MLEYLCYVFFAVSADMTGSQKRHDELKNQLREDLKDELRKITESPGKTDSNARAAQIAEYFELVFECVYTRRNFLNVITLNSRNPVEPDIDLVILQALLNGKSKIFTHYLNEFINMFI